MKKWILFIWLFCMQLLAVHAENEYYTIFKIGSNICTPVTLKTPYGNYTIHTEITIPNSRKFPILGCHLLDGCLLAPV